MKTKLFFFLLVLSFTFNINAQVLSDIERNSSVDEDPNELYIKGYNDAKKYFKKIKVNKENTLRFLNYNESDECSSKSLKEIFFHNENPNNYLLNNPHYFKGFKDAAIKKYKKNKTDKVVGIVTISALVAGGFIAIGIDISENMYSGLFDGY